MMTVIESVMGAASGGICTVRLVPEHVVDMDRHTGKPLPLHAKTAVPIAKSPHGIKHAGSAAQNVTKLQVTAGVLPHGPVVTDVTVIKGVGVSRHAGVALKTVADVGTVGVIGTNVYVKLKPTLVQPGGKHGVNKLCAPQPATFSSSWL